MDRALTQRLHLDYLKVYRINWIITEGILLVLLVAYLALALWKEWTMLPIWIGLAVLLLLSIIFIWIVPKVIYSRYKYELFEDELEIQSGLIFITNVLVPMVKVQHVELETGPLMRKYELAKVAIVTAATKHTIDGLKLEQAQALKRRIGILAKVDDQDE